MSFILLTTRLGSDKRLVNVDAIDECYSRTEFEVDMNGTTIILRSGRVVEVRQSLEEVAALLEGHTNVFDYSAD